MSWVSERHLVAALSNAGAFGVIACGRDGARPAGAGDRRDPGADRAPLRREPHHHASPAGPAGGCLPRSEGRPYRLRRRHPAGRRHQKGQGRRRQGGLLRPGAGAGEEAGALRRRCAGDRGLRGRRAYRPGLAERAGAGDPAAYPRRAGLRRRRHRPGRGDPVLSGDGRGRRPARHPFRLRHRMHRPPALQARLHPRQCAGRDADPADRRALPGHSGPRPAECRRPSASWRIRRRCWRSSSRAS